MPDVAAAIEAMGEQALALDGVEVRVRGRTAIGRRWTPDVRHDIFSASKSVTSLAIGIAQDEGLLSVDDRVLDHLGALKSIPAPGVDAITIHQLLTMTSGIVYRWTDPDADHPDDPALDVLTTPLGSPPGTAFAYRGANTYLLSRIIHACSGQDLRDYLVPRLFDPLGIRNPQWLRCPLGYSLGAVGLQLRTRELGAVTQMLRDRGRFDDRQLVPADYVDALMVDPVPTHGHIATGAADPHPDNARYGRHVWLCARDDAWRMDGIYGQFGIVLPHQHACITVTAHYEGPTSDILDALWSTVVPALRR